MFPDRYVVIRPGVHHYLVNGDRTTLCGQRTSDATTYDYPPSDTRACGSCRRHPQARNFR